MKKYKLGEKHEKGYDLFRIIALKDFKNVKAGTVGGYIASEINLSQDGDAWVYDNAQVYGDAWVSGNAQVYGKLNINYTPVSIAGLKYPVTIFTKSGYIQAGCYLKTVKEWENITEFKDQEFLNEWKDKILAFAK